MGKQHIELEAYLREQMEGGKHEFRIVPRKADGGKLVVYIHPLGRDGDSRDFEVDGNAVQDCTRWLSQCGYHDERRKRCSLEDGHDGECNHDSP